MKRTAYALWSASHNGTGHFRFDALYFDKIEAIAALEKAGIYNAEHAARYPDAFRFVSDCHETTVELPEELAVVALERYGPDSSGPIAYFNGFEQVYRWIQHQYGAELKHLAVDGHVWTALLDDGKTPAWTEVFRAYPIEFAAKY